MRGFDACTAPSLRAMEAWRPEFRVAAIYLGGPAAACGWGNLSRSWVRSVRQMGWLLLPTYVGPQAPCTKFQARIKRGHAGAQGRVAADEAISLARLLGLYRGAPVYDDMEFYRPSRPGCRRQVLAFLDGWTRELHARHYRAGVYSSASAAISDLGRATSVYGHRIAKPNSVWFGLWDNQRNLIGTPYVRNAWWAGDHRSKQYRGAHWRRIGGFRLNIDSDLVDGAVYG